MQPNPLLIHGLRHGYVYLRPVGTDLRLDALHLSRPGSWARRRRKQRDRRAGDPRPACRPGPGAPFLAELGRRLRMSAPAETTYFPPAGDTWERRDAAEAG